MDTKELKQKILDLAIRGKLVPQDPNDEPASVLLERIREQKQQMVKEGKLKAKDVKNDTIIYKGEDNLHYEKFADGTVKCIEDEIPFEVPEGWVWCRLKSLAAPHEHSFADGPFGSNLKTEHYTKNKEVRIIQLNNIGELIWKNNGIKYTTFCHAKTLNRCKSYPGDIVIAKMMPAGRAIIIPDVDNIYVISSDCVRLQLPKTIDNNYIMYMINSTTINEAILKTVQGIGRSRTSLSKLKEIIVPLPNLVEQQKIAKKIYDLLSHIDSIDNNISYINNFAETVKTKILDLAIRGKLVPQNPNDEPASVLLEQIRIEKEELIKQGKIKRDKKESLIFRGDDNLHYEKFADGTVKCIEDEIPFEVPEGWEWCRLKSICTKIIDGSHNPPKGLNVETPYIMASSRNIILDKISDLNNVRYLTENDFIKENIRTNLQIDDILLTTVATLGRSCIYKGTPNNLCFQRSVTIIKTLILPLYLKFYFDSPFFQQFIKENSTGTAQKGFYLNQLEMTLICIPPLDYQKQMVKTITDFMLVVSNIEKSMY